MNNSPVDTLGAPGGGAAAVAPDAAATGAAATTPDAAATGAGATGAAATPDAAATREPIDAQAAKELAAELHGKGFNCAQSVACALGPELGLDADTACRLAEGFGAGMGGMSETCGAISGAVLVLGWENSRGVEDPTSKRSTYRLARSVVDEFRDKNGATLCRELKGIGCDHPALRSCPGCIDDAVDIAVSILNER